MNLFSLSISLGEVIIIGVGIIALVILSQMFGAIMEYNRTIIIE